MNSSFPTSRAVLLVFFSITSLLGTVAIESQTHKKGAIATIPLNETIASALSVVEVRPNYRRFVVDVPDTVFSIEVAIENSPADLDIILYNDEGEVVAYSEGTEYNETLAISRIDESPLLPGRYHIEVGYQYSQPPRVGSRQLTEIPFDLSVRATIPGVAATLAPGDIRDGLLTPKMGMIEIYRIDVPPGTPTLRFDISETDADLDLFLRRDLAAVDPYSADHWSQSVRAYETLAIDRNSTPPLRPGTYFITVIDQLSDVYPVSYRLSVSDTSEPPEHLAVFRAPPRGTDPIDRVLLSTVEVLTDNGGGSGVVIHPDGYIITNFHVIIADSGLPADTITVGYSRDYGAPPVESYLAEVVETNEERDLALLQIVSGRYGEALSPTTQFEYLEPQFGASPTIGDELRFIGYPSIGGTGSRASITVTRGIVAGYQDVPFGRLIKTDAEINEGSSGGAAIDGADRLIGFPTEVVGLDSGQLAYIYPVSAIPERWRRIIAR